MAETVLSNSKSSKGLFSTNFVLSYYLVLGVIQALWTSQTSFPPMVMRLGMIALVVAPLFFKREIIPFVFVYSITLRMNFATGYSYLPDIYSIGIYILMLVILYVFHYGKIQHLALHQKGSGVLLFMVVYWSFVDIIYNGTIGQGAYFYLMAFVLLLFYDSRESLEYGIAGYILSSTLLAVYYFVNYRSFAVSFSTLDVEKSGWSDPNYFSIHLGIGLMFCICLLFRLIQPNKIFLKKYSLIAGGVIIFLAIVATGSRGGFIAALIITFIALMLSKTTSKNRLFTIFAIVFVLVYVLRSQYAQFILYRFSEDDVGTAGARTIIWSVAFNNFWYQSFEYLLVGGGWLHRFELTNGLETHNEVVGVLCDYGIIGVITMFTLYLEIISNRVYRKLKGKLYVPFIYLLLMIITLSPSQFPLMPMYIVWLISSYRLKIEG